MEGRVLEKWCCRCFEPGVRCIGDQFMEALQQARFANAGLADDQHHLPLALKCMFPTVLQQTQFLFASNERGQSVDDGGCFEPPPHSARLNYLVKLERPFNAL